MLQLQLFSGYSIHEVSYPLADNGESFIFERYHAFAKNTTIAHQTILEKISYIPHLSEMTKKKSWTGRQSRYEEGLSLQKPVPRILTYSPRDIMRTICSGMVS